MKEQKQSKVKGFALGMALVLAMGTAATSLAMGIKNNGWFSPSDQVEEEVPNEESGGAIVNESASNGIKVMSAKIPVAAYSENGISPQAETAYTLTATITPDSATDKSVDWEIAFKNPSSEWATDKVVAEYVTVTPTSDGALTANIECLQAFGEQIIVKVVSRDNPLVSATCQIDYAQKITGVTLKLGDIPVNIGGTTNVKWQINANGEGFGGIPSLSYTLGEVYTLKETVSSSIELVKADPQSSSYLAFGGHTWSASGDVSSIFTDITASGIVFNRGLLEKFNFWYLTRSKDIYLNDASASEFLSYTSTIENGALANVVVTLSGVYGSYEYTSCINISEFVNTASVTGLSIDNSTLVF